MIFQLVIIFTLLPTLAFSAVLDTAGQTYPFAERDALTEVVERARQVDWRRLFAEAREKARHFRPKIPTVPRAATGRHRQVEISYVLDVDMPDPKDPTHIRYPKGFTFNPLQYFTMPACVVFVNAADRAQREWLTTFQKEQDPLTQILLTGGDLGNIEQALKRPVYYADALLLERFGIEAAPSVACQSGTLLDVEEIDVRKNARR